MDQNIRELTINTIRMLSAEAIEKANSGHPGLPLGAAPIAYAVWMENLKHNPADPGWQNRDRFVLSAGHGSMLDYSMLYLFGYGLTKEDLMEFRQFMSKTPGHPEYKHTVGIETTTGPLGQGIANAVGMAIAEAHLAAKFNRPDFPIVDHYTYAICGDGCMQEGIEYEAASLAGTLKLGKLIVLYDRNKITIEGSTDIAFTEDVKKRHEAQGWHVIEVEDGNNVDLITKAIKKAKKVTDKPSLIICKTTIGFGSPKAGSESSHGAPLGAKALEETRKNLNWTYEPFEVPSEVEDFLAELRAKCKRMQNKWKRLLKKYKAAYPELYAEYDAWMTGKLPNLIDDDNLWFFPDKPDATRNTSFTVLNKLAELVPNMIGGSADLAPSNKSNMKSRKDFSAENYEGSNMHFGIREHAMAAISNGMCLHGGLSVYCATFFVFSDYMKNAMRMSAIMNIPVTYVLTHDSIGVGEDGPTHQPIEQLAGLRSIPNLRVFRPADGKETTAAWISAMTNKQPTCLVLSRQNLPQYEKSGASALKGGYILSDSVKKMPDVILIASGSEVQLAMEAQKKLAERGVDARVVSMPCMEVFEQQSERYRDSVLPRNCRARVAIEAGSKMPWYKYVGLDGEVIGMDTFGASGPADELFTYYGFTVGNVVEAVMSVCGRLN